MNTAIKQFSTPITITLVALGIYQIIAQFFPYVNHIQFYTFLGFFFIQEVCAGYLLRRYVEDRDKYISAFFIITGARFLLAMIVAITVMMMFPDKKDLLALSFCLLYIYYLATDTYLVASELKRREKAHN